MNLNAKTFDYDDEHRCAEHECRVRARNRNRNRNTRKTFGTAASQKVDSDTLARTGGQVVRPCETFDYEYEHR